MKKLIIIISICFVAPVAFAQDANITAMEYYVDTDPGVGNGTVIAFTSGTPVSFTVSIPTTSLSPGMHVLVVRAQDQNGDWSIHESRAFYVSAASVVGVANIAAMEYFLDSDPGFGNGTAVALTAGPAVNIFQSIAASSLSPGFHVIHYRARDSDGVWGLTESRVLFVTSSGVVAQATITALEYFFDSDPGYGNGTAVALTAGTAVNIFQSIAASSLSPGFHVIHYRARDSDGVWGLTESRALFVTSSGVVTQATITALEYFFDSDPGYGNGTPITITSGTNINMQALVATASLTKGFHIIHVRARDADGVWGMSEARSFFIDNLGLITGIEYYFDTDPGIGSATLISVAPPQATIDMNVSIPTTSLANGTHTLGMRIRRTDNTWSDVQTSSFAVCSLPTADFTANTVCVGTTTTFTDNSSTVAGDTYQWDFDSNGTIDDNTTGNTLFTYPASGNYSAKLVIDRSGCTDSTTVSVQVGTMPVANAGADQNVCVDNTTLVASALNAGETGTWTLLNGAGTISNASLETSSFTDISVYSNTLSWTVTNTAIGCSDTDEVIIISNQPIVSTAVNATVSLGETINADVQTPTTKNSGDVLITTIITAPKKGSAVVLADGTINFSPDAGTVGNDTLTFQLCNQCSKCSVNNLVIGILNNAPVITPQPLAVVPGGTVNFDLQTIISDPNNNLDLTTLSITQQPVSGAIASIDASFNLIIDYTGVVFSGTDQLTIEVCDAESVCASNIISIEVNMAVDPPIRIYNAISRNGDNKHDFLEIENITAYPENHVYIFNRWGDKVFEAYGYDNDLIKFDGMGNNGGGKELIAGTYYYTINLGNGTEKISGYLLLKK